MRALASVVFGIAASTGACIAAASVASLVMADSERAAPTGIPVADLWTSSPVRVDTRAQNYERVPAVYSSYVTSGRPAAVRDVQAVAGVPASPVPAQLSFTAEHLNWCAKRYRSFDPATNRYRPYSGDVRECISPFFNANSGPLKTTTVADENTRAWCAQRYRSYRPEDNSYRPYKGTRRTCVAPTQIDLAAAD